MEPVAKRKRAGGRRGANSPDNRSRGSTGRVRKKPDWEPAWNRASRASSLLGWIPDSPLAPGWTGIGEQTEFPGHQEVFVALGELESSNDALRQLALVAELLEFVEHVDGVPRRERIRIDSLIRRVAEGLTDASCASFFSGYVDPKHASRGDPNQSAGRLLRSFRDHDIAGMVQAANANNAVFRSNPTVGLLTLCPLLSYEFTRESSQLPLKSHVADFLADLSSPVCNAEPLQDVLFAGLALPVMSEVFEAMEEPGLQPMFTALMDRVAENQVLVGEYLKWSLRLEAVMNVENPSRSLPQCGQEFHSVFATKASLLALLASERPGMLDFKAFDAPQETVYGQWQSLLAELSPDGFSYRSVDSFAPEDLAKAFGTESAAMEFGIQRLSELVHSQPPIQDEPWDLIGEEYFRHLMWLNCLSDLLRGETSLPEFWTEVDPESWGPYLHFSPVRIMQMVFLTSLAETGFSFSGDSGFETQGEEYEQFVRSSKEMPAAVPGDIGPPILDGDLSSDELRALGAWTDLVTEIRGVEIQEPHVGFDVTDSEEDVDVWLGHFSWWLKERAWRPEKERPAPEDAGPAPAAVVKPSDTVDEPIGTGPEYEVLKPDTPMEIVFVGGLQEQARNDLAIEAEISQRYEDLVTITWVHIDWTSNWRRDADQVVGRLERGADVLVLMPLVRTGMGSYVRREAGRLDVPWVACTGRGTGTVTRALEQAVQVVCQQGLSETP